MWHSVATPSGITGSRRLRAGPVMTSLELRRWRELAVEGEALLAGRDGDRLAVLDGACQDHLGERVLHRLLDHALQRTRAIGGIPALVGQPFARAGVDRGGDLGLVQQLFPA